MGVDVGVDVRKVMEDAGDGDRGTKRTRETRRKTTSC